MRGRKMFKAHFVADKEEPKMMHFTFEETTPERLEFVGEKKESIKFKVSKCTKLEVE